MLKTLTKPAFIFAFVSLYAITAFAWWTYAHIRSVEKVYISDKENLEMQCYKATFAVNIVIQDEIVRDTNDIKTYLATNFPQLEIVFIDAEQQVNPYDKFLIRPSQDTYNTLRSKKIRAKWMYSLEGAVMVLLLIWGIVWIYRSLLSRLDFNRRQNNFMLSITHELKTPLASVKLYLETLLKRTLDKAQTDDIIKNSVVEVNRLSQLVDNILMASQLESNNFELNISEVNASKILQNAIETFCKPRNISEQIKLDIEENVFIEADAMALETIVTNLLSNAVKYSPAQKPVSISLKQKNNVAEMVIADEGNGISQSEKKNLFTKFYRAGNELTRKTKGTGLGLFIVKNLLNLLKAEIEVLDNKPQGTIFVITFKQSN